MFQVENRAFSPPTEFLCLVTGKSEEVRNSVLLDANEWPISFGTVVASWAIRYIDDTLFADFFEVNRDKRNCNCSP